MVQAHLHLQTLVQELNLKKTLVQELSLKKSGAGTENSFTEVTPSGTGSRKGANG